jgi:Short C-terminal domain
MRSDSLFSALPAISSLLHAGLFVGALTVLAGCGSTTPIQLAASSKSGFDGAVYSGETSTLDKPTPDEPSYRIFQQGATGFVSISAVRADVEEQAVRHCERAGKTMHSLVETAAKPPYILGNFPRVELVFECVPKPKTRPVAEAVSPSKYDKLASLKKLLDSGALTQAEFDREKTKLLAEP